MNDSLMYVSANPITGKPVTLWHDLSAPRRTLLEEVLSWRHGPSGITLAPEGGAPVVLSDVKVTSARLTRKVTVKQGDSVLYASEQAVTPDNLDSLCSCTIVSTEWNDIPWTSEDIEFSVEYWRHYETEYGGGSHLIVSDLVMISVRMR